MSFKTRLATLVVTCITLAQAATAHEFWIAPEPYQIDAGDPIRAQLRVGSDFAGSPQSYFPQRFARFEVKMGDDVWEVEGRIGDIPAMDMVVEGEGLAVILHETKGDSLQYRTRELFESFVAHKDLTGTLERHAERGLPELEFREAYTRYAKSLVAIGSGEGADARVGLKVEVVAEANPYTDDLSEGFPVQVFYEGEPRREEQVEVFERAADGAVTVTRLRTDTEGRLSFPVTSGSTYLVDSVVMEDTGNDDPEAGPVWHSAWASLTFTVP